MCCLQCTKCYSPFHIPQTWWGKYTWKALVFLHLPRFLSGELPLHPSPRFHILVWNACVLLRRVTLWAGIRDCPCILYANSLGTVHVLGPKDPGTRGPRDPGTWECGTQSLTLERTVCVHTVASSVGKYPGPHVECAFTCVGLSPIT